MKRVTLAEPSYDKEDVFESLDYLKIQLEGRLDMRSAIDPDKLRLLYSILPQEVKHEGLIYRSIAVSEDDLGHLFDNKEFRTLDLAYDIPIESWSASEEEALKFSYEMSGWRRSENKNVILLLESYTGHFKNNIVMDMSPEAYQYLYHFVKNMFAGQEEEFDISQMMEIMESFEHQQEIMIVNPGEVSYTFCVDVTKLLTVNADLHPRSVELIANQLPGSDEVLEEPEESDFEDEDAYIEAYYAYQDSLYDEEDRAKWRYVIIENVDEHPYTLFTCESGNLTIEEERYDPNY